VRLLLDLAYFSDATLPLVLTSLASRDRDMNSFIADELQKRATVGYAAVAALVASRPTTEEVVRVVVGLGYKQPARVAADILAVLEFQDSPVYKSLISSLVERLTEKGESDDASVERVVWSLSRIARSAAPAYDRKWAVRSLGQLHRMNSSVKRLLRVIVMDDRSDMDVCMAAIQALIEAGDVATDLADRLLESVKKTDSTHVPDSAVELLAILRSPNADMLDGLILLLSAQDTSVRRAAVRALGSLGYNAAVIGPALTHCLSDEDPVVRDNADAALQRIRRDKHYATLDLEDILTSQDDIIRKRAIENLRDLREDEQ
jgi:hypothetical protein